ncbi:MAG TPA: hypothetical protein VGO43_16305 [Pyrinomonadaceae bacterium]|nr:hypothetical protein [Pyrinomonadaceae bacterium]
MNKINFTRLIIGGVIATVILFVTDGLLHEKVLHEYWQHVYEWIGGHEPAEHGMAVLYFLVFELGRGFLAILLYALMRPFHGPGPKTAVFAAIVAWLAFSITGPAQFIPLGFYSKHLWLFVAGAQLVTSIVGNLIAAWLYKDASPVTD